MRGSRGGGEGGSTTVNGKGGSVNGGGAGSIPAASKKVVQNLKEIVNCPELEIYAMLKECDMDPNEAVNRLLSQDPFHEVKSKREKKKENKDATDSRSRGINSTSSRGGKGGTERYGRAIMSQFAGSDSGVSRGNKSSYKKDNGAAYSSSSSPAHGVVGNSFNRRPPVAREAPIESKVSAVSTSDITSSVHSATNFQPAWGVAPGQVSMADIVKRGRPQGKAHTSLQITNQQSSISSQPSPTPHEWKSAQNYSAKVPETVPDSGAGGKHDIPPNDDWPVEHPPASSLPSISEPSAVSEQYTNLSSTAFDRANHQLQSWAGEVQYVEDSGVGSMQASKSTQEEISNGVYDDELYKNMNSHQAHQHGFEQQEAEDVATNMQQLNLSKEEVEEEEEEEEEDSPREANSPAVKIPDHLQVQTADCSHLSFGSFGSGMIAPFSGPFGSRPAKSDLEETSAPVDEQPVGHSDTSNTEYYGDEHLRTVTDEHIGHRLAATTGGYDVPSASQSETLKQEASEVSPGNQYSFPSSSANYRFENNQDLNVSFSHPQASSQMQNLPQLSGVMAYSSSLPSNLLVSSVQSSREAELSYSPFPITQSMPNKYSGNASSIGSSAISMTEALKAGNFATAQPSQNLPSGSSLSGGPALPQQLTMHPYSQPTLPFAAANMMGYPFLPQSYTYMPQSAFQQAFAAGNSTYHQSLAAVLPQYKNSVSVSSLPQSAAAAALASGYGAFGSSNSVPGGNFPLNAPGGSNLAAAPPPPATSMRYDDVLSSQYKEAAHLLALQQNESSPLWVQGGPGSRTISAVPASTYYGFQGQPQHQQPPAGGGGYRQTPQPPPPQLHSQNYGSLGGYPNNFYQSNLPIEQHHHLQMAREGVQGGQPQSAQPKQPQHQQIWQSTY